MLTCGTGLATGHCGVPKHASAAWDSGQTPKCLQPSICSLWTYSSSPLLESGSPSASTYSFWLAGGSGAITATLARNSIFMPLIQAAAATAVLNETDKGGKPNPKTPDGSMAGDAA